MTLSTSSTAALSATARSLYRDAPPTVRALQSLRPHICPFAPLIAWVPERGRLLDVGCGAGLFLGLVGEMRPQVEAIGFDANPAVIAAAQGMAHRFGPARIRVQHLAVQDPWPSGTFDAVSIVDVLHHIPPAAQQSVIEEAWRHVAPGGVLIYKDMADRPLIPAWWNRVHDLLMARQWIHYRALRDVEAWLTAQGADVAARGGERLYLYQHEWIVARKAA